MREEGLGLFWDNSGWIISSYFIPFFFVCIEDIDLIYLVFVKAAMLTILKGLEKIFIPDMPLKSYSLLGSLTCLGVTTSSFVLKSY